MAPASSGDSGRRVCSSQTQKYSDRLTLFRFAALCDVPGFEQPEVAPVGSARKVPITISEIHSTRNPNWYTK